MSAEVSTGGGVSARLRQAGYVVHLARVRLTGRPAVVAVAIAGVALAAAAFAATVGGGLVVEDRNVGDRFAALPLDQRSVEATHFGVIPGSSSYAAVDHAARQAVAGLTGEQPVGSREVQGAAARRQARPLVAADDPGAFVSVANGRLPGGCTAERCELIAVRGDVGAGKLERSVHGRRHGPARRRHVRGSFVEAGTRRRRDARRHEPAPILLACDPAAPLAAAGARRPSYRTYGWVAPLTATTCASGASTRSSRDTARARNALRAVSDGFELARRRRAARGETRGPRRRPRLRLVGGETAGLCSRSRSSSPRRCAAASRRRGGG